LGGRRDKLDDLRTDAAQIALASGEIETDGLDPGDRGGGFLFQDCTSATADPPVAMSPAHRSGQATSGGLS